MSRGQKTSRLRASQRRRRFVSRKGVKMIVDFDGKPYNFDLEDIDVRQASVIKVKTGYNLLEWQAALE